MVVLIDYNICINKMVDNNMCARSFILRGSNLLKQAHGSQMFPFFCVVAKKEEEKLFFAAGGLMEWRKNILKSIFAAGGLIG